MRLTFMVETLLGDVRYALRRLRRSPGFTLVAILVLAVGIGVNTSVFTFANGLLLKRLPAAEPDRLVRVHSFTFSSTPYPEFLLYREQTTQLESLVATRDLMLSLRVGDGVAEPVFGELVSDDFFELLRVPMAEGRRWRAATDDQPGEAGIVLSDRFWRQRFDGDLGLIGETVWLSGQPVTVAGVLPAEFSGVSAPNAPALWAPMSMAPVLMADPNLLNPVATVNASRVNVQMLRRFVIGNGGHPVVEVVGLVQDSTYVTVGEEPRAFVYRPLAQRYDESATMLVATMTEPSLVMEPVRQALARIDRELPIFDSRPLTELTGISLLPARVAASLLSLFGLVALALAATGLYGVVAFLSRQRAPELGIRLTLGARPTQILATVLAPSVRWVGWGLLVGVVVSLLMTRLIAGFLYGVSSADPLTYGLVALTLTSVALLAAYLPARRAAHQAPMTSLRTE